jgi:hypothetical protein
MARMWIVILFFSVHVVAYQDCAAGTFNMYVINRRDVCGDCTNTIPAGTHYTKIDGPPNTPDCPWGCGERTYKVYDLGAWRCYSCPVCAANFYVSRTCTSYADPTCQSCSGCGSGTYQNPACSTYANTNCQTCTACTSGNYQQTACGGTSNTNCQPCSACIGGKYKQASCTTLVNTNCQPCSACVGGTYQQAICTTSVNTNCQKCSTCGTGKYQKTACGATTDTVCESCAACVYGTYPQTACGDRTDTICQTCSTCGRGMYQQTACTTLVNTVCQMCSTCSPKQYVTKECSSMADTTCEALATSCPSGQYISFGGNATSNIECTPCTVQCGYGMYMSRPPSTCDGKTDFDIVADGCTLCPDEHDCDSGSYYDKICYGNDTNRPTCTACTDPVPACNPDYQWIVPCTLTHNRVCRTFPPCPLGNYSMLLPGNQESCRDCTSCLSMDLRELRQCQPAADTVCSPRQCNESKQCALTNSNAPVFCEKNTNECGICPPGYSNDDQMCVGCPMGFSCNSLGVPACKGECPIGYTPLCDSGRGLSGFVTCVAQAQHSCAEYNASTTIVVKGGYTNPRPGDCYQYFECKPGYVKYFNISGFAWCEACYPHMKPAYAKWTSSGLDINNKASCLWECDPAIANWDDLWQTCFLHHNPVSTNKPGWVGNNEATCPQGYTSQADRAWNVSQCIVCPTLPNYATWLISIRCTWKCVIGIKHGNMCTRQYTACPPDTSGYTMMGGQCTPTALPWQKSGFYKTGVTIDEYRSNTTLHAPSVFLSGDDQTGFWAQRGNTFMTTPGLVCSLVLSQIGGMSFAFFTLCGQSFISYRNLADVHNGTYILIGNATSGWNEGFKTEALFGSELYITNGLSPDTLYVLDTLNCLVREITIDYPGSYKTRSSTLYGKTKKLELLGLPACYGTGGLAYPRKFWTGLGPYIFFLDAHNAYQLNLVTNEVATLLGGRGLSGLAGSPDVSIKDYFQLSIHGYTVTATSIRCPPETTSLAGGDCDIPCPWLNMEDSPENYVDQATGACMHCTNIECDLGYEFVACTPILPPQCQKCPPLAPFNGKYNRTYTAAATCDPTTVAFVPPCPKGFYANGLICIECPDFSTTLAEGANQITACVCVEGMTLINGTCYPGHNGRKISLYPMLEPNSCGFGKYFRDKTSGCMPCHIPPCVPCELGYFSNINNCWCLSCNIPYNAKATSNGLQVNVPTSCNWECNIGFYPSSTELLETRCRPCTNILSGQTAITNGASDSPGSCIVV